MYVPQKSSQSTLSAEKTMLSWLFWHAAETKISVGLSHVTGPAELIEMAQYWGHHGVGSDCCSRQSILIGVKSRDVVCNQRRLGFNLQSNLWELLREHPNWLSHDKVTSTFFFFFFSWDLCATSSRLVLRCTGNVSLPLDVIRPGGLPLKYNYFPQFKGLNVKFSKLRPSLDSDICEKSLTYSSLLPLFN